ncbi:MAG TPA: response regulator transcription factor [Actinophytocola sp.]|uniref:response regulator transcription factor n=1 Tax=Actinophytocola sp. TaxID=1872138 RepID=UPI002DB78CD3|nr:response regulator transcription factor [Actinophytocola sp.]HEU5470647.1 response regulator transcription factor [Actinophytocola sp.]
MTGSPIQAWESDNSQFHVRRRACLAARERAPDRLAVLVIDHDTDILHDLTTALAGQPIEIRTCPDPAEALLIVGRTCPDAVILGPATGRLSPTDFLTILRADDPAVPIIVGAGAGSGELAATATELGATMVVPRPYRAVELLTLLRSLAPQPDHVELRPMAIDLGRLRIDGAVPQMWLDGVHIDLPPMEFLLIRYFAERAGSVVTRRELLRGVWGERNPPGKSNTLTVHIMRLRKRLGDDEHNPQWIKAIRGLGYQFLVPHVGSRSPDVHQTCS